MADALVISANSFVGRYLAAELRSRGVTMITTARNPTAGETRCDLENIETLRAALKLAEKPRWIFQCAGGSSRQPAEPVWKLHVEGTFRFLSVVRECSPNATVVLFGSSAEYGPVPEAELPITEATAYRPVSAYGQSKLAQTHLAMSLAKDWGLRIVVVRPFNILGPGLSPTYLTYKLIRKLRDRLARNDTGTFVVHNGSMSRDWIDVRDVVAGILSICDHAEPQAGECSLWNLARGQEIRVLDLARVLCRLAGPFDAVDGGVEAAYADVARCVGSSSKLQAATGWSAKYSLEQSLAWMWENS